MLLFVPSCQNIGLPKTSIQQMIWKLEMLSHVWKLEMIYFRVGPGAVRQFTDAMAVRVENSENRGGHEPMTCLQWRTPGHQGLEQEENLDKRRTFQVFSVEKLQHVKQITQYIQFIFQLVEQKDLGTYSPSTFWRKFFYVSETCENLVIHEHDVNMLQRALMQGQQHKQIPSVLKYEYF